MKKLNTIIDYDLDINVCGITDDYSIVKDGYIFVATKGYFVDHFKCINKAIDKGCVFLVVDRKIDINFPHIIVDNINDYYNELCKKYYDIDLDIYNFYGITGTDGKTTTASIVSQLIDSCSYMGTNGLIIGSEEYPLSNTTPCISELYDSLNIINKSNIKNVSMEVSSEALLHDRVKDFRFKIVGITNVTGDHLSVHKSFFNYLKCKLKILDLIDVDGFAFINGDDKNLKNISLNRKCYTYGFSKECDFYIKKVEEKDRFLSIVLVDKINNKNNEILSPFFEKFNVYNVVLAFLIAKTAGIDENTIIEKIKKLKRVKGRCEELNFGQKAFLKLMTICPEKILNIILDSFSKKYPEEINKIPNDFQDKINIFFKIKDFSIYEEIEKIKQYNIFQETYANEFINFIIKLLKGFEDGRYNLTTDKEYFFLKILLFYKNNGEDHLTEKESNIKKMIEENPRLKDALEKLESSLKERKYIFKYEKNFKDVLPLFINKENFYNISYDDEGNKCTIKILQDGKLDYCNAEIEYKDGSFYKEEVKTVRH